MGTGAFTATVSQLIWADLSMSKTPLAQNRLVAISFVLAMATGSAVF
jgi:hypothetical protein